MSVRAGERQALSAAVLASILLHLVLLSALPGWREALRPQPPAPILARVIPARVLSEPVADPPAKRDPVLPKATPHAPKPALAKPSESRREDTRAREPIAFAPDEPAPSTERAKVAEPAAAMASGAAPLPRRESGPTSPAAAVADAGTLAQYRLAIIALARGFNRYPRIALENNWQGRVEVRMNVGADGGIASIGLRNGSGHEILDRQALDMIGRAAPQVPLPAALRGREFSIDIAVIFSLKDADR